MKLKLDENLPHIAAVEGRMLVTMDRGFADIRRYPPGQHPGILLLRLSDQRPPTVAATLTALLQAYALEALAGCVVVAQPNTVRVRRPRLGS